MAQVEIKNSLGNLLGYIKDQSDCRKMATTRQGSILGFYNPKTNLTQSRLGSILAKGDILSSLIMEHAGLTTQ